MSKKTSLTYHYHVIKSLTLLMTLTIIYLIVPQTAIFGWTNVEENTWTSHCGDIQRNIQKNSKTKTDTLHSCIWGQVYYQGRPIDGARVILQTEQGEIHTTTQVHTDHSEPYYRVYIEPQENHLLYITAKFAKQIVTQPFHITSQSTAGNGFTLGIASKGIWKQWYLNIDDVNALSSMLDDETLLAANNKGLTTICNAPSFHTLLNLSKPNASHASLSIRDLARDPWGNVWAVVEDGIAIWREYYWEYIADPILLDGEWETLTISPETGDVWIGGKSSSSQGEVVVYNQQNRIWSHLSSVDAPVTALAVDGYEDLWIGTWGAGVYQHSSDGRWMHYQVENGLPSNYIHVVYSQTSFLMQDGTYRPADSAIWIGAGTSKEGYSQGNQGGVGYYSLDEKIWRAYTTIHGLPANQNSSTVDSTQVEEGSEKDSIETTADVYTIIIDNEDGLAWAGTSAGLYILGDDTIDQEHWTLHDQNLQEEIRVLRFFEDNLIAATSDHLIRLTPSGYIDSNKPSISVLPYRRDGNVSAKNSFTYDVLQNTQVTDTIAWHWESNLDGLFCTSEQICRFDDLSPGIHQITLRIQNQYGEWSLPATTHLSQGYTTYLPTISQMEE